jgi:hypothetical protein
LYPKYTRKPINQTKETTMKTTKTINKTILVAGMAFALAVAAWMPGTVNAQDGMKPMKGGEHLMMLNQITTQAQVDQLKPGDSIAMACPKCKSVSVEFITQESRGHVTTMTPGEKHLCPGCGGSMTVEGVGKGASTHFEHVCSVCGSDSAFCCATSTNSPPTTGMEQK